jgi:hypothetical protein
LGRFFKILQNVVVVFSKKEKSALFTTAFYDLQHQKQKIILNFEENHVELQEEEEAADFKFNNEVKTLHKSSKFYQLLSGMKAYQTEETEKSEENPFYNPEFLDFFLEKYISIFPLWTAIIKKAKKRQFSKK